MDDASVEFLLENLRQLRHHQPHLIADVKSQIERLESSLLLFKRFLRDSTEIREDNMTLEEVAARIAEAVYKAEDAVDIFVSQAADKEAANYFKKRAFDAPAELLNAVEEVELVGARVGEIYNGRQIDFSRTSQIEDEFGTSARHVKPEGNKIPSMMDDYMVGFEDVTETLIGYLTEKSEELDVIPIFGMGGIGKTTLARAIFRHPRIEYNFPVRIWVYVSSDYRLKDIFLTMLRDLSWITEDMYDKTEREIAQTLHARLEKEKFLIVLDDVWTAKAWDDLQIAFPKTNKMSKILITSRGSDVAKYVNPNRSSHKLRWLNRDESWKLLQLLVFGANKCFPNELEDTGKDIARQCKGLPFVIKLVGGVLRKTTSVGEMEVVKRLWTKVAEKIKKSVYKTMDIISLSYIALPCNLKPCFLYLGMFPEDFEIPVERLILLWIAEGFIQQKPRISLEETAKEYLEDLITRNLVTIDKVSATGRIKTCRVHDFILDFCYDEAFKYLCGKIQDKDGNIYGASASKFQRIRHVSISSKIIIDFLSSQPYGPHVRSFLHSSREEIILLPENVSAISDAFKLLRVLDVRAITFTRFPFYLTQLVHLRYIALSSDFKVLPEAISKLWNIQTIIVFTSSRILEIKADILKMVYLRHLETNASIILCKRGESGNGETIQVLANLSPESCIGDLFERTSNLKKLGIRGRLTILLDDMSGSSPFDDLEKLHQLENLKLLNDVHIHPDEAKLPCLPPPNKFPPQLISLRGCLAKLF
ncbi:UNVERIFIED_CONTAM: putative late blight resistance proteinR1B-17 [Sesamum radiatum]|uniref:Late blight resistance proteinR1B-17 n=1 Tax=Sesamum radiatum TaxID=300843 RepID=A0AAW2PGQ2_SESRA